MTLLKELKLKYRLSAIHEKFIFINISVFAVIAIFNAILFLFTKDAPRFFIDLFALPENLTKLLYRFWTIITYCFLHFSFWHLIGNMLGLYFFGRVFTTFFSTRQFINYYFLGGIVGGLIFVIAYNTLPALIDDTAILYGASASVFSILMGATTRSPNYEFSIFGFFRLKLWVIAVLYIISFIALIPGANTGGELAHLGGALLGYIYTKQLDKGTDIGKGFEKLADGFINLFKSKSHLKTVHRKTTKSKMAGKTKDEFQSFNKQKQIDTILDKISKSGYESLTAEEKEFLFRAGK